MEFFLKWVLLASAQLAATISPGPAFVMLVRNAMVYGRHGGILTAFGLAMGVGMHVLFVLAGLSFITQEFPDILEVIRYVGAAYLCYIGIKALRAQKSAPEQESLEGVPSEAKQISAFKAFLAGFMTNVLNPKAVIFFTAVYTQFITVSTPWYEHVVYGLTSVVIEGGWFMGVAVVLTNPIIKARFMKVTHWVDRACGGLMIALGVKLALSR